MADRIEEQRHLVRASEDHAADPPLSAKVGIALRRRDAASEPSPHSRKFRVATAMLVGVAVGAIVVAVALAGGGSKTAAPAPWSDWAPPDSGNLGARDIADHVAPFYRISAADQLAVVTVMNLTNASPANVASSASGTGTGSTANSGLQVAVKPDPTSSGVSLLSGTTIGYNLCGIGGANCAIGLGQPSADRLLLLRREALELALYTFKYDHGVDNVVAILPPGQMQTTGTLTTTPPPLKKSVSTKPVDVAVLFVRSELQPWLSQPLSDTLPEQFPPSVAEMGSAPEAGLVDQITARGLFSEKMVQAQDGSNLIVLDPLPPQ
jgi:hypothetical protein